MSDHNIALTHIYETGTGRIVDCHPECPAVQPDACDFVPDEYAIGPTVVLPTCPDPNAHAQPITDEARADDGPQLPAVGDGGSNVGAGGPDGDGLYLLAARKVVAHDSALAVWPATIEQVRETNAVHLAEWVGFRAAVDAVRDAVRAPLAAELQRVYGLVTHWSGEAWRFEAELAEANIEIKRLRANQLPAGFHVETDGGDRD